MAKSQTRPPHRPAAKKTTAKGAPVDARQAKLDAARKTSSTGPNRIVIGTIVAVIAIIAVVAGVIINSESNKNKVNQGGKALPSGVTAMGQGWVANADVAKPGVPTVSIFEDFRCPVCKTLEDAFGSTIEQAATAGKIKVVYHFKTVIDGNTNMDSSQQAANNALCAADQGAFWKYHDALYANQPKDEKTAFTTQQFTAFAEQAGITGAKLTAYRACVDAGKYLNYVKSTEDASFKAGITGTPAFYINNQPVAWTAFATADRQPDTAAFEKAITTGTITDAQKDTNKLPKISD